MKVKSILLVWMLLLSIGSIAQIPSCPPNLDFETGTIAPWLCYTGRCCPIVTPVSTAPVPNRHTITSGSAVDYYGSFPIVAPGSSYSLRLGNDNVNAEAERVRYYIRVPPASSNFTLVYRYAVVLEDPKHGAPDQPRFDVNLSDSATGIALPCGSVSYVSSSLLPGFKTSPHLGTGGGTVYYHDWDWGTVNLTLYSGSTITVDFSTGDCNLGGHFGYAYLDVSCNGAVISSPACDTTGMVTLSAPLGFKTYAWYDSATFTTVYGTSASITIPNPGKSMTYSVVMDPYPGFGCLDTLYVNMIPSALSLHPSGSGSICIGTGVLVAAGAVDIISPLTYSWSPSTGLTCTGCPAAMASPTVTTTYTVTVTNPNGCKKDTTITITVGPPIGAITGLTTLCVGTGSTLSNPSGGGTWSSTSTTVSVSSSGVVTGVAPGTSVIKYTITTPCGTSVATTTVTVLTVPVAAIITGPGVMCQGGTITLSTGSTGGVWSASGTAVSVSSSGVVTGLLAGTATISYTLSNSCGSSIATKTLTVLPLPTTGVITGSTVFCVGSSITLSSSLTSGSWSTGATVVTVGTTGIVTGVSPGTAVISYALTNSCGTSSATYTVTVEAPPTAIISGPSIVCVGASILLTGTTPGGVWSFTGTAFTLSPTGKLTGTTADTGTVTYTNTNSCGSVVAIQTVTVNPLPDAGIISGGPALCSTDSIVMSETVTGGTWSCTFNATISSSGVLKAVNPGNVIVNYTVTNSCGTAVATLPVTINLSPSPGIISGPLNICTGTTITVSTTGTGGRWRSTYPGVASITSTGVAYGIMAGTSTIIYTVSNNYCADSALMPITVDPLADPGIISGPPAVCAGATIGLSSSQPGGVWSAASTVVSVSTTGIVSGLAAGTVTISYTITNSCGPVSTTKTILVNPLPDPGNIYGPADVCAGASISLSDAGAARAGTWSSDNTPVATINSSGLVNALLPGVATITYMLTVAGCTNQSAHIVTVDPLPPIGNISGSGYICADVADVVIMLKETEANGVWSSSNPAIATIDPTTGAVHAMSVGGVTITYTSLPSNMGCINMATFPFSILATAPFAIRETITNISCKGKTDGSIALQILGGIGPWQYLWSNGIVADATDQLSPGAYDVKVADVTSGCKTSRTYMVTEPDSMDVTAKITDELCDLPNGAISLVVKGGTPPYNYKWFNNSVGDHITNLPVGVYTAMVADINKCLKSISADVVQGDCLDIEVHDGISPNGDGNNDLWIIRGIEVYKNNLVELFDKWGDKVFEQRGYDNKWDGRGRNGSLLPDGTYFYIIKLNAQNGAGGKNVLTGPLLIKR